MIFTLNFQEFLHTMYKYALNFVVKISVMFAKYFKYYTIILKGPFFLWTCMFDVSTVLLQKAFEMTSPFTDA